MRAPYAAEVLRKPLFGGVFLMPSAPQSVPLIGLHTVGAGLCWSSREETVNRSN
jgi:hypothetical protein